MLESGYIKLYRSLLSWEWYTDHCTKEVFLHLLLTANYEPVKWRGHLIDRGQRVVSLAKLSEEINLSVRSVRTALNHLKATGEVTSERLPECSIITIKNYSLYQEAAQETTNERQTSDKPPTNDRHIWKKEKESKKEEEYPPISPQGGTPYEEYRKVFVEYCPSLPAPNPSSAWTAARKKSLKAKRVTVEEFRDVCKKIERSDFLTGRDGKWKGCSFDWILKPANWQKIMEGNYDNKTHGGKATFDLDEFETQSLMDLEGYR